MTNTQTTEQLFLVNGDGFGFARVEDAMREASQRAFDTGRAGYIMRGNRIVCDVYANGILRMRHADEVPA